MVVAIGCSRPVAAPPHPGKMALTGKIACTSDRIPDAEGINQVFVMDGSRVTRLTNFPGTRFPGRRENSCPSFSPDGRKIAFHSRDLTPARVDYQIYVMNADGSAATRLTNSLKPKSCPVFSPNGQRFVFEGDGLEPPLTRQIFIMNSDGSGIMQLTRPPDYHTSPRFSPDGRKFVAICDPKGRITLERTQIWFMDADGGKAIRVLDSPGRKGSVVFSPDGRKIAFDSREPREPSWKATTDIYLMNTDGSDLVVLVTSAPFDNFDPAFSA